MDLTLLAGLGRGDLPLQKYFELESGFSGYERFKTFRTLHVNTYVGFKKLTVYAEHNFQNSIFQLTHLPLIKDLPYDLYFLYNWGWVGNAAFKQLKFKNFYSEWGMGLGRIFSLFKIEFLWRVKRVQLSKNFIFTIKTVDIEL